MYTPCVGNSVICTCTPRYDPYRSRSVRGSTSGTCIGTATFSRIGACCSRDRSTLNRIRRFLERENKVKYIFTNDTRKEKETLSHLGKLSFEYSISRWR